MWSTNLTPKFIEHGRPGKHNEKIYVAELYFSSYMIQRHVFLNKRIYLSFISHLDNLFPSHSNYYSGVSYYHYELFYTPEDYRYLINDDE